MIADVIAHPPIGIPSGWEYHAASAGLGRDAPFSHLNALYAYVVAHPTTRGYTCLPYLYQRSDFRVHPDAEGSP